MIIRREWPTHGGTGIWRDPDEETEDYPGLVVHDGRVTGSITTGHSRLPLWAFAGIVARHGWSEAQGGWDPEQYGWTAEKHDEFVYNLLEARGEFGRLLCVLADVQRQETERDTESRSDAWWETPDLAERVRVQLERCLGVLVMQEKTRG